MCSLPAGPVRLFIAIALGASAIAFGSDFSRTVSAQDGGQVEISAVSGEIEISGWEQPQIEVRGTISSSVERVDVLSDAGGHATIKVVTRGGSQGEANLKIRLPKNSDVEANVVSADLRSMNIFGEQRLQTVSGNINAEIHGADTETKTISGDTLLHGAQKPIAVRATSVSGDIHYEHGAGNLEAATVSGDLVAALEPGKEIRLHSTSGDALLTGRLASGSSIEADSVSGELIVRMKPESGFRYMVSSFSGDITNCWNEAAQHAKYGPGSKLSGERGEGKTEVRLKTMSGDVQLCDR